MQEFTADPQALRAELDRLRELHDATERRLRASHAVARVLSEATSVEATMPQILGALGTALGCSIASFWVPTGGELTLRATWVAEGMDLAWDEISRDLRFKPGEGLPGGVWQTRGPVWIDDIACHEGVLPRRDALLSYDIRSGFAFAVAAGAEICGVIDLFSRRHEPADDQLVEVLRAIGGHLGQFIEHANAKRELEHEVEQRENMVRAGELFSQSLDVDTVLSELARFSVPWLGDLATVHLRQADGSLRALTVEHADPDVRARVLELERSAPHAAARASQINAVAATRETRFVPEIAPRDLAAAAARGPELADALAGLALGSYAIVPIIARDEVIGTFSVATCRDRRLAATDVVLIEELAKRAALAVANARLYEAARTTTRELDLERTTLARLDHVGRTISAELDQQMLVQAVIDVATQVTSAQFGAFFYRVPNELGDVQLLFAVAGASREAFLKFPIPSNTQVFGPTFDSKEVVCLDDVTEDPRYGRNVPRHGVPDDQPTVRSYLAVPVISRSGEGLGALIFGHERASVFSERAQRLAVGLAAHAATAVDNARLFADQQRLIKELERTNAELDQFAYVASHDLRAPLRGIANLASWIEEDLGTSVPKKVREHITLLKGRATRMDRLINGLLELARIGRAPQRVERVDVTELLHETIDLVSAPEASRILIIGAMPTMNAERFALQQVFLNLIGNAIQHAGRKDVVVRITAVERPDEHEFTIADNGVGIPAEHHDRVWQIFQTLQARDIVESTGIGLTIVKKQVEASGGRAWIDPAGPGATLRFTLPKRVK